MYKVMKIHCESSRNARAPPASNTRAVEMTTGGKNTSGILDTRSTTTSVHTKKILNSHRSWSLGVVQVFLFVWFLEVRVGLNKYSTGYKYT